MSNIAGKAYAMNVITPIRWYTTWTNKLFFKAATLIPSTLKGLQTLSLIHYARWVIIPRDGFPHLDSSQPKEDLHYAYMLFSVTSMAAGISMWIHLHLPSLQDSICSGNGTSVIPSPSR